MLVGKVFIEKCRNVEDCFDDLLTKVPSMAMSQGVKLLIIDRSPLILSPLMKLWDHSLLRVSLVLLVLCDLNTMPPEIWVYAHK